MINSSLFSFIIRTIGICLFKVHSLRLFRGNIFHSTGEFDEPPKHPCTLLSYSLAPLTHFTYPRCWRNPPLPSTKQTSKKQTRGRHWSSGPVGLMLPWSTLSDLLLEGKWEPLSIFRVFIYILATGVFTGAFGRWITDLLPSFFGLQRSWICCGGKKDKVKCCGWKQLLTKYSKMWIFHPAGEKKNIYNP